MPVFISCAHARVVLEVVENPTVFEINEAVQTALSKWRNQCPLSFLVDLRNSTENRSFEEVRTLVHQTLPFSDHLANRHAFLVSTDLHFGIGRMFASLAEVHDINVSVFRDMKAACQWLTTDILDPDGYPHEQDMTHADPGTKKPHRPE